MKSLIESLFDDDLVTKKTGNEYLYGVITTAEVNSSFKVEYFDTQKINKDFNKLLKNYKEKDWSKHSWKSMAKIQKMPMNEDLRQLTYIIATKLSYTVLIKDNKTIAKKIIEIISDYIAKNTKRDVIDKISIYINTYTFDEIGGPLTYLFMHFPAGPNNRGVEFDRVAATINITYQI